MDGLSVKMQLVDGKSFGSGKINEFKDMAKLWCATVHFFVLGKEPSNFNLIIFAYQIVLLSSSKGPNTDLGTHTTRNKVALMSLKV